MFTIVRRYIKTSLFFFLAGLALGTWILFLQFNGSDRPVGILISAHSHLILFGFIITLIMGVAYWMFPRPAKDDFRYSPSLTEINYWMITIGTIIRAGGEITLYFGGSTIAQVVMAVGAIMQLMAGVLFSWNIWTRIRPIGSHLREGKGEKF